MQEHVFLSNTPRSATKCIADILIRLNDRCEGKCAYSKDGHIVVDTDEAQNEVCEYRALAWDWQRQRCRMTDRAMLKEDPEHYLTLHLDTAVYKAVKYKENCQGIQSSRFTPARV